MPAPSPQAFQFGQNAAPPGGGAALGGYNNALQQLQKSLGASNNTTQAGQMQLGQQLQQNQAGIGQNLANRGLGNTTVANTMQQAPLQTYNLGMAQLGDLSSMRQMGAYNNLANMSAQGGQNLSQMTQPYAQTNFTQQKMQQLAPGAQAPPAPGTNMMMAPPGGQSQQQGGGMNMSALQNLMNLQNYNQAGGQMSGSPSAGSYGGMNDQSNYYGDGSNEEG